MSTVNGPQAAFGVGSTHVNEAGIALEQQVTRAHADHRGVVEMPAYAVMAESVTSGAYWYSLPARRPGRGTGCERCRCCRTATTCTERPR